MKRPRPALDPVMCPGCRQMRVPRRTNSRYCRVACRMKAYRRRKGVVNG